MKYSKKHSAGQNDRDNFLNLSYLSKTKKTNFNFKKLIFPGIALIAVVLIIIASSQNKKTAEVTITYSRLSSDLRTGADCYAKVLNGEIKYTMVSTRVSMLNDNLDKSLQKEYGVSAPGKFDEVKYYYYLIDPGDGSAFFLKTYNNNLTGGSGKIIADKTFYGKKVEQPLRNPIQKRNSVTTTVETLDQNDFEKLSSYPIIESSSTYPETREEKTNQTTAKYIFYLGIGILFLLILGYIAKRFSDILSYFGYKDDDLM